MKTFCTYFDQGICRSCSWLDLPYEEQLQRKEGKLRSLLGIELLPSVHSSPQGFRNKAKLTVTGTVGEPILGLVGEDKLDAGREILACPVHHPAINQILQRLPEFIKKANLIPYQISSRKGELKGIIVFHSAQSKETYLRFILRSKESLDRLRKFLPEWQHKLPGLTCITANIQPIPHAILEGEEEIFLTEGKSILHKLNQWEQQLDPRGFVQTNQDVAAQLYATAATWISDLGIQRFAELFSGQGAFSFQVAPRVKEARGFEINSSAVVMANESAKRSGLKHLDFYCADAASLEEELKQYHPDVVLVNPPRRGLGESLKYFQTTPFAYLIYSSCNPDTLASDIAALESLYEMKKAQLFDMFPHTSHFETLVLLQRR